MFTKAVNEISKGNSGVSMPGSIPKPGEFTRKRGTSEKSEQFKQTGIDARKDLTEAEREIEGSKSDKVVLVTAIGNPAKSQQRRAQGGKYIDSKRPCGYCVRLLEDMEVPHAPLKEDCVDELDVESPAEMVMHKAGEEIALNIIETAIFISQPQFAGFFTGEGKTVKLSYSVSQNRPDPYPSLKMLKGSVKEAMPMAAERSKDGKGWVVLPQYADVFGPLFKKHESKYQGTGKDTSTGEATRDTAAAFLALYKGKGLIQ